MTTDEFFMEAALDEAEKAQKEKEVPIGAVVVRHGEIVGRGYNKREYGKNALYHAEILAINDACKNLGGWRLWECELYVTMEPCPMCAGAIINSRIKRIVYGCRDSKAGAAGSIVDLFELPFNHKPVVCGGVLEEKCSTVLSDFFRMLRAEKNNQRDKDS